MKLTTLLATVYLSVLAQSALADDYAGAYLGAGLSTNSLTSSCADGSWVSSSCNDPSSGSKESGTYQLVGGYNFDKHFGVEAGYVKLGTYRVMNSSNTPVGEFKASAVTVALRGGNIFANGFSVFGKLGLASVRTQYAAQPSWTLVGSTEQTSSGFVGGVAGQYDINSAVAFRASADFIKYTDSEFNNVFGVFGLMAVFKF